MQSVVHVRNVAFAVCPRSFELTACNSTVRKMLKLFFCISRLDRGELGQRFDSIRTGIPFAGGAFLFSTAELTLRDFVGNLRDKLANEPVLQPDESAFSFRHPAVLRDRFWKGESVSH